MRVLWALLCQTSAIDRDSNNMSLFNVMEEVRFPTNAPVVPMESEDQTEAAVPALGQFQLVILWSRSHESVGEKSRVRIRVLAPGSEKTLTIGESEVDLNQFLRLRQRVNFSGIPLPTPEPVAGTYEFIVEAKSTDREWEEMDRVPLRMVIDS